MVRAWYKTDRGDDRDASMPDTQALLPLKEVTRKTGVILLKFSADFWSTDPEYAALKESRGYNYEDECELSRQTMPEYDKMVKIFSTEHLHADEEIRFVLAGTGYFDVRDYDDRWIRLEAGKDDLLIMPAGIYHRFFLDSKEYIKVKRLFSGTPGWVAFNRPEADTHPARAEYLQLVEELRKNNCSM